MDRTWVLLAHRGGARLYGQDRQGGPLRHMQDIPHPEGRLKNREITADKEGRLFDSFHSRHTVGRASDPKEQLAVEFARHLADLLQRGRTSGEFEHLVLVADPHFLGDLRAALDAHTAKLVTGSLAKDLYEVPEQDLPDHLRGLLKL